MAKNNRDNKKQAKGFATDRKRINTMARILAIVLCAAMVVTTFVTWGIGMLL